MKRIISVLVTVSIMFLFAFPAIPGRAIYGYEPARDSFIDGFVYRIKAKTVDTKCIDVLNAYTSDGSVVWL